MKNTSPAAVRSNARELYHLIGLVIRSNPDLEESSFHVLNMIQSRLDDLASACDDSEEDLTCGNCNNHTA